MKRLILIVLLAALGIGYQPAASLGRVRAERDARPLRHRRHRHHRRRHRHHHHHHHHRRHRRHHLMVIGAVFTHGAGVGRVVGIHGGDVQIRVDGTGERLVLHRHDMSPGAEAMLPGRRAVFKFGVDEKGNRVAREARAMPG